jgi:uncharacterized membrane protein YdbT with pleckstrin-like domain
MHQKMNPTERKKLFNLQEGEKIIKEIKPLPNLRNYWWITGSIGFFFLSLFIVPFLFGFGALIMGVVFSSGEFGLASLGIGTLLLLGLGGFLFIALIPGFVLASMRYKHQWYWVTTKRIIFKHGLLGYGINSIPLERISDVKISRGFIENIFGFGSLHIQSLSGQVSAGRQGAEASLMATPEPEKTQELIFGLVKKKRKREKLTF